MLDIVCVVLFYAFQVFDKFPEWPFFNGLVSVKLLLLFICQFFLSLDLNHSHTKDSVYVLSCFVHFKCNIKFLIDLSLSASWLGFS